MAGGDGEIINLDGRIDGGKYSTRTGELIDTDSCLQTSTSNTSKDDDDTGCQGQSRQFIRQRIKVGRNRRGHMHYIGYYTSIQEGVNWLGVQIG